MEKSNDYKPTIAIDRRHTYSFFYLTFQLILIYSYSFFLLFSFTFLIFLRVFTFGRILDELEKSECYMIIVVVVILRVLPSSEGSRL